MFYAPRFSIDAIMGKRKEKILLKINLRINIQVLIKKFYLSHKVLIYQAKTNE